MGKKTAIKIIAFALLLILSMSPILLSGELLPTNVVLYIQDFLGDDFLFGKAYSNDLAYYKFSMLHKEKAEVLTIGSSRVLQFRNYFFNDDTSFYNAGFLTPSLYSMVNTLPLIEKDALPEVLILGIDEYYFNTTWFYKNELTWAKEWLYYPDNLSYNFVFEKIFNDFTEGKLQFYQLLFNFNKIGVNAKINGNGVDKYGAYIYNDIYEDPKTNEERTAQTVYYIENELARYYTGDDVESKSLEYIEQIATFCNENDVNLIIFTPPLSNAAMNAMDERGDMQYVYKIEDAVSELAKEYGFEFYYFTNPDILNLTDDYFIDGFHGSDSAYLLILRQMLLEGSVLNEYANIEDLNELYDNRISDLEVK